MISLSLASRFRPHAGVCEDVLYHEPIMSRVNKPSFQSRDDAGLEILAVSTVRQERYGGAKFFRFKSASLEWGMTSGKDTIELISG